MPDLVKDAVLKRSRIILYAIAALLVGLGCAGYFFFFAGPARKWEQASALSTAVYSETNRVGEATIRARNSPESKKRSIEEVSRARKRLPEYRQSLEDLRSIWVSQERWESLEKSIDKLEQWLRVAEIELGINPDR